MPDDTKDIRRTIKSAYMRTWVAENREARAAYQREYAANNRETLRENKRRYREKSREKIREASRKYANGESGNYQEVQQRKAVKRIETLEALAGRPKPEICDICSGPPDKGMALHFDHCHQTGRFRGWLCRECNLMLGNSRDDPARLRDGAAYLERFCEVAHD